MTLFWIKVSVLYYVQRKLSLGLHTSKLLLLGVIYNTLVRLQKYFQSKTRQVELRDRAKRKRIQRDQRRDVLRELVKDLDRTIQRKVCRMTAVDLLQVQRNGEYSCETIMKCFCARSLFVGER